MEQRSQLPPLEEIREEITMKIFMINLDDLSSPKRVKTTLCSTTGKGIKKTNKVMKLYEVDNQSVAQRVPTRIWWDKQRNNFSLLYYVSPHTGTKFASNLYLLIDYPQVNEVVEYPLETKMLIDQVFDTPYGTAFVYLFDSESYNSLIHKDFQ